MLIGRVAGPTGCARFVRGSTWSSDFIVGRGAPGGGSPPCAKIGRVPANRQPIVPISWIAQLLLIRSKRRQISLNVKELPGFAGYGDIVLAIKRAHISAPMCRILIRVWVCSLHTCTAGNPAGGYAETWDFLNRRKRRQRRVQLVPAKEQSLFSLLSSVKTRSPV